MKHFVCKFHVPYPIDAFIFSMVLPSSEYCPIFSTLESMNAYSMYLEREHRDFLYEIAPQVLLRISQLGLSVMKDSVANQTLLNSLPRGDECSRLRQGFTTLSLSPGTMANIVYRVRGSFVSGCLFLLRLSSVRYFKEIHLKPVHIVRRIGSGYCKWQS